jgi:hypothetical protein
MYNAWSSLAGITSVSQTVQIYDMLHPFLLQLDFKEKYESFSVHFLQCTKFCMSVKRLQCLVTGFFLFIITRSSTSIWILLMMQVYKSACSYKPYIILLRMWLKELIHFISIPPNFTKTCGKVYYETQFMLQTCLNKYNVDICHNI